MTNANVNEAAGVGTKSAQPRRAPSDGSAKCATCKFFERAFPLNYQLGYCKGIEIERLDGGGIAISRRIFDWLPGDEALRLMDDFGCAYHSPNDELSDRREKNQ